MVDGALPTALAVVPSHALDLGHDLVPMAGSWDRDERQARFRPRFALAAGAGFAVVGRGDSHEEWVELATIVAPARPRMTTTVVESVDPRPERVPANLLRFSIAFSAPMEEGSAAGAIALEDGAGAELAGALLEMPPELWDRERRRLTVLLEPGRIKRGLQPNLRAGPPLREHETVALVVASTIRDATGARLPAPFRRVYSVGPAIRSRVDPGRWDVRWPESPVEPLVVVFDRPLDRALVDACLTVVDGRGLPVPGLPSLDDGARTWTFSPPAGDPAGTTTGRAPLPWKLRIATRLEDLAGNSVRRVFDRDVDDPRDDPIGEDLVFLEPAALESPDRD